MQNSLLILLGKTIVYISKLLNIGSGSTWPGHIALNLNRNFIKDIVKQNLNVKVILIAGTNGKTTTGKLIQTILEKTNYRVFQNESGANLLNGIASTLILYSNKVGRINYDYAIFEVDEATLPLALKEFTPDYLIILNLFRDQLDRYGEVNAVASKWKKALDKLTSDTSLILNADDPQVAYLGLNCSFEHRVFERKNQIVNRKPIRDRYRFADSVIYFGLKNKNITQKTHQHAVDSIFCPNCSSKLYYHSIYYSHLGDWECKSCGYKRPRPSDSTGISRLIYEIESQVALSGTYNLYNLLSAILVTRKIGVSDKIIRKSLKTFTPAFGRQEMLNVNNRKVQIFLSKNPASFNESLRTIAGLGAKNVLLVLNDRVPDGRDVSWIWDVDTEELSQMKSIIVSGDRAYDMGLRIKYSSSSEIKNEKLKIKNNIVKFKIINDLKQAIGQGLEEINGNDTLYIMPTYSAMLEVRKILTGKKIL